MNTNELILELINKMPTLENEYELAFLLGSVCSKLLKIESINTELRSTISNLEDEIQNME